MTSYAEFTLAAIQAAPVYFDRDASTEKACGLIDDAARQGATLAAFGETWLPGYPFFAGGMSSPLWAEAAAEYIANAVEIPSPTTDKLCAAARKAGIDVVIGIVEREPRTSGTVYCTLLFIGREGVILGRHRKLKPTTAERIIWGEGDALGLRVHQRPYARISGLNCWEHNMVLPGYVLMDGGTQIHVGAWPGGNPSRQLVLSQAFASQGACYVIVAGGLGQPEHVPERYRELAADWAGDSYIIDPWGNVVAGPAQGETILTATGSLETVYTAKAVCDVAGHYSRPDILQLHVNRRAAERVIESSQSNGSGLSQKISAHSQQKLSDSYDANLSPIEYRDGKGENLREEQSQAIIQGC
ncbi:carbon-nitrogen hydrolase family protein [soil metagenome]